MCAQKPPIFYSDITSAVFKNFKTRFKKQNRLMEQFIAIFGTIEDFYMYWHLEFYDIHLHSKVFRSGRHTGHFLRQAFGKKGGFQSQFTAECQGLIQVNLSLYILQKKLNFLIPDGSSTRAFITPTLPSHSYLKPSRPNCGQALKNISIVA